MQRLPLKVLILTVGLLFSSLPLSVAAANTPGTKCVKAGTTAKSGSISVKCLQIGNRLIWQKAAAVKTNLSKYVVGDTGPGGGKIFYVAPTPFACGPTLSSTCNYLEAAPTTGTAAWKDAWYAWSATQIVAIGTTGTAIGTGHKNTLAMASQNSTAGYAGTISLAYRGPNGKTDWFLPSRHELDQLRLRQATVGGFVVFAYWTSSENGAYYAWAQSIDDGYQNFDTKDDTYCVRPVRAF